MCLLPNECFWISDEFFLTSGYSERVVSIYTLFRSSSLYLRIFYFSYSNLNRAASSSAEDFAGVNPEVDLGYYSITVVADFGAVSL